MEDLMSRIVKGKVGNQRSAPALTARQQQILRLITDGYTSREIGKQLKISVQTVEVHRFNLMRRLEVRNVAQLIRQALVLKYLPKSYPERTITSVHS
jgi:DNA-binding NarL/FixJ family response regulator